jgi:hypothetical protein
VIYGLRAINCIRNKVPLLGFWVVFPGFVSIGVILSTNVAPRQRWLASVAAELRGKGVEPVAIKETEQVAPLLQITKVG